MYIYIYIYTNTLYYTCRRPAWALLTFRLCSRGWALLTFLCAREVGFHLLFVWAREVGLYLLCVCTREVGHTFTFFVFIHTREVGFYLLCIGILYYVVLYYVESESCCSELWSSLTQLNTHETNEVALDK